MTRRPGRPAIHDDSTVRRSMRIPEHLGELLDKRARANNRSANAELVALLDATLSGTPTTDERTRAG